MLNVHLTTNGCVEGQLSTKHLKRFFIQNQCYVTDDPRDADIVLFYACGLTNAREEESLEILRLLKGRVREGADLIVWGCLPKVNPEGLREVYKGPLVGALEKGYFEKIPGELLVPLDQIDRAAATDELTTLASPTLYGGCNSSDLPTAAIFRFKQARDMICERIWGRIRTLYIPIATGCTGHCAYCSERPIFGRVKSRPTEEILDEFARGLQQGYNRFSLIATDLGAYGADRGHTLPELLQGMLKTGGDRKYRIVLNQIGPDHLKERFPELCEVFASGRIEELMSPVQCGSDRILRLMGRRYAAGEWREMMLEIHKMFPKIRLNTQLMVGFPSETEEDFDATVHLLNSPLRMENVHIFSFSKRPTIPASRLPGQVPEEVKRERSARLFRQFARHWASRFLFL